MLLRSLFKTDTGKCGGLA